MRLDLGRTGDPEFSSPFFTSEDALSNTYLESEASGALTLLLPAPGILE